MKATAPLEMQGGTIFHFATEGAHTTLERRGKLRAGDEMRLAVVPALLGAGEQLETAGTRRATHVVVAKVR